MTVVVTGAAGFIGSHLCERLLADGRPVLGIDAFTRFYPRELKEANVAGLAAAPGFTLAERNLLGFDGLTTALRGADAVCHLAGRPGVRSGATPVFEAGNVRTTEVVLRAAAAAGVRRVVFASSSSVYGPTEGPVGESAHLRPLSPYGRSKRRAERVASRLAARMGLDLVILRLFTVYGPRQRPDMAFSIFISNALADEPMPVLGDGGQRRDFTYVGDAVEAARLALDHGRPGGVYNVSGGRPAPLSEAIELVGERLGVRACVDRAPADAREPRSTEADLTLARAELGYEPRTTLAEGIALQVEHASDARAACAY